MGYYTYSWEFWGTIAIMILGVAAQSKVQSTFKKYSKMLSRKGITGAQLSQALLMQSACNATTINRISGNLSDHFDPRNNTVNLSDGVYGSTSVAALGVAAHECGHVMQHNEEYTPIKIRNALLPIANIGSKAAIPLMLIGLFLGVFNLIYIGILFFAFAVVFQLVTLPVELNASSRALACLESGGYLDSEELIGAKKVLTAAAMTYVVSALSSVFQLLRFVALANSRRD